MIANDSGDSGYIFNLAQLARRLERERDAALDREAAIRHFCEVEMSWEWFRVEFNIGDTQNKSLQNAKKLKEFLSANTATMASEGLPSVPGSAPRISE